MSRLYRFLLVVVLALFTLACSLVSRPVTGLKNAASTAEAFASEIPAATIPALSTMLPAQTIEALPSLLPDLDKYFHPTGTPMDEWKHIPIMPQATVGEEFGENTYSYNVPVTAPEVEAYYAQQMQDLGWSSLLSVPVSDKGGILSYQRDEDFLIITITPAQNDGQGVNVLLQK